MTERRTSNLEFTIEIREREKDAFTFCVITSTDVTSSVCAWNDSEKKFEISARELEYQQ